MAEVEIKATLTGEQDVDGVIYLEPLRGAQGYSAYELAVKNGYTGTEARWVEELSKTNYYRKYRFFTIIDEDGTFEIPISFSSNPKRDITYRDSDILEVYVNGLKLANGYSIEGKTLIFGGENGLNIGTEVEVIIYRTVVANEEDFEKLRGEQGVGFLEWNSEQSHGSVTEDIENIINVLPKGTVEDENVMLSDSADYPIIDLTIKGKSEQDGEPTPDVPVEVKTVKGVTNLFDLGTSLDDYFLTSINGTKINEGLKMSDYVTATFTENGISISNYNNSGYPWISKIITLEKNTDYIISGSVSHGTKILGFSSLEDETIGTQIGYIDNANAKPPKTFNSGDYAYYVIAFYPPTGAYVKELQVEPGLTTHSYVPYGTWLEVKSTNEDGTKENTSLIDMNIYDEEGNITDYYELCSIGDIEDRNELSKDKNKIVKWIGKIVLDGSEGWTIRSVTLGYIFQLQFDNISLLANNNTIGAVLSDKFPASSPTKLWAEDITGITNLSDEHYIRLKFKGSPYTTLEEFKTWLSENPVTVYYELAEPEYIDREVIELPKTYKNITHISTNDDLQPKLEVKYLKDIETLLGGVSSGS